MRRRQFISTLPIAAATPALGQPAGGPAGGQGWVSVPAQRELPLAALGASQVIVTGAEPILGFGPCSGREGAKTLLFQDQVRVGEDRSSRLICNNGGLHVMTRPGDMATAHPMGGDVWRVVWDKGNTLLTLDVTAARSDGAYAVRFTVPGDHFTAAPGFAFNGADSIPKFYCKAIFVTSPGNQVQFAGQLASGTAHAPKAPRPGDSVSLYAWAFNEDGSRDTVMGEQALKDKGGLNHNQYFDYIGRIGYVSITAAETASPTARGGLIQFCTTPLGKVSSFASGWFSPSGNLCVAGRGRFEDGAWDYEADKLKGPAAYPYAQILTSGRRLSPGGFNPQDHHGWGNLTVSASDKADNAAIAIRKYGAWSATGFDVALDHGADELQVGMVKGGAKTWRWGFGLEGHLMPVQDAAVDLGAPGRRLRRLHAAEIKAERAGDGAVIEATASDGRFASDVVLLNAAAPSSRAFNFWRGRAAGSNQCSARGDGHIHAQAFDTGGAGFSEFLEWADGNPGREDRVGVSVVLDGDKIRPARHDDPSDQVIGVVSGRPGVIGNAASLFWRKKYALDPWGRRVMRRRAYVHWFDTRIEPRQVERERMVLEKVRPLKTETVMTQEEEPQLVQVDGKWVRRMVKVSRPHQQPMVRTEPLHDEDGQPVFEPRPRRDADGRPVLDLLTGQPVIDRVPVMVSVPVYEDEQDVERRQAYVDTEDAEVGCAYRCYPLDAVPADVVVPMGAERFEAEEPALDPAFDESLAYTPREERPEWASVSYMGQELVREGQPAGSRWIRMRQASPGVELWLVR
jgi:hypothetical protein